jgi:TetR/AcrR family transcriptional regulator
MNSTRTRTRPDSRTRILAAAAHEFAARGFEGANMDRLARAARLNKAMIYYHFRGKAALYGEVFREFIRGVLDRLHAVEESDADPRDKIRAFVLAITAEAQVRPHFPPMWLREVAGGGRHVDQATLGLITQIPATLGRIVAAGAARGTFRPVHPLLLHFGIVGPLILYYVTEPVRVRLDRVSGLPPIPPDDVLEQIVHATLATLDPVPRAPEGRPSRQGRRS